MLRKSLLGLALLSVFSLWALVPDSIAETTYTITETKLQRLESILLSISKINETLSADLNLSKVALETTKKQLIEYQQELEVLSKELELSKNDLTECREKLEQATNQLEKALKSLEKLEAENRKAKRQRNIAYMVTVISLIIKF